MEENFNNQEYKKIFWHSSAHILATVLEKIFGNKIKLGTGPAIENGFYYDIEFKTPITQQDLQKIENEMKNIIKADLPIERYTLSRKDAVALMKNFKEHYKVQLIEELPEGSVISFYKQVIHNRTHFLSVFNKCKTHAL